MLKFNIWIEPMKIYNQFNILFTFIVNMPKRVKITLYTILILAIIAVVRLMFWQTNLKTETPANLDTEETLTEQESLENNWDTIDLEAQNNTFEDDVMKDLEWFFNDNNGYEDVEWEYWFTNTEDE